MFTEVIAFLARPEDYRAIWRDGELTIEALPATEPSEERATAPLRSETPQRTPSPAVEHGTLAAA